MIAATPDYRPAADSADYVRHALSIAHGHGYPRAGFGVYQPHPAGPTAFRPPLYPFLLGATFALTGDSLTAGRLLTAALGAIAVALIFLVAEEIWGRGVATVAAGLLAGLGALTRGNGRLLIASTRCTCWPWSACGRWPGAGTFADHQPGSGFSRS